MPAKPIFRLRHTMCQHDFTGRRIFQHRNLDKWSLYIPNKAISGFLWEKECLGYLAELRTKWSGRPQLDLTQKTILEQEAASEIIAQRFSYKRIGYDERAMTFKPEGLVGEGIAGCEVFWDVKQVNGHVALEISSEKELTCRLIKGAGGVWQGSWEVHEKMPIRLAPQGTTLKSADEARHDLARA